MQKAHPQGLKRPFRSECDCASFVRKDRHGNIKVPIEYPESESTDGEGLDLGGDMTLRRVPIF